jgi:hypothetical protein
VIIKKSKKSQYSVFCLFSKVHGDADQEVGASLFLLYGEGCMEISRRKILAGMALTGVLAPAGYFAAKRYKAYRDKDLTPDAPKVELADAKMQHLSSQLRGIWLLDVSGMPALEGLPGSDVQMFLDVAERGRG